MSSMTYSMSGFVPFDTILELNSTPSKDVESTPNGKINLSLTEAFNFIKIL